MYNDCHIHTGDISAGMDGFIKRLDEAGVSRAILLSYHPLSFNLFGNKRPADRLALLMEQASASPGRVVPFYWIDPLEDDAHAQVDKALKAGVSGFKAICNRYYPGDCRPMEIWEHIAKAEKPILFHSGILWSNSPSSHYNRPVYFEHLFGIPGLKFALAHVSWPWCDECLALYGHWQFQKENGTTTAEMFIDTTPGTPPLYRSEVIHKIYHIGYELEDNIIFGTDCTNAYDVSYAGEILKIDAAALDAAGVTPLQREKYYLKNFERFLSDHD